jgi:tripartite-type tricarboxylate transporter receptor subunit TctC
MRGYKITLARRRCLQLAGAALAAPLLSRLARAQGYPARPVRVIVTTGPGGQGDTTARLIAQKLTESLGQQFYVENIPGAGGNIAHGTAARAQPDGHTILAAGGSFVANPSLFARIPYDPYKDFAPITLVCSSPHVLAVHPSVPANSVKELVALAQANPGR